MPKIITIDPEPLSLDDLVAVARHGARVKVGARAQAAMRKTARLIASPFLAAIIKPAVVLSSISQSLRGNSIGISGWEDHLKS